MNGNCLRGVDVHGGNFTIRVHEGVEFFGVLLPGGDQSRRIVRKRAEVRKWKFFGHDAEKAAYCNSKNQRGERTPLADASGGFEPRESTAMETYVKVVV